MENNDYSPKDIEGLRPELVAKAKAILADPTTEYVPLRDFLKEEQNLEN